MAHPLPLVGKTALVTGASRRRGIGFAVAAKLARLGASVFIHHYHPHDDALPWGGDDIDAVRSALRAELTEGAFLGDVGADLCDAANVQTVLDAAYALTGGLDILVCNHARSGGDGTILDMTPERLDAFWDANARSTILLTSEFARRKSGLGDADASRPGDAVPFHGPFEQPTGHVFWMTSGQIDGAMRGEVSYATSKAALAGVTRTVAAELMRLGIVLNTINPGPVNTGYLDADSTDRDLAALEEYKKTLPFGRFGVPADPAELIGWLATPGGSWVVGRVITSDGGFSLGT